LFRVDFLKFGFILSILMVKLGFKIKKHVESTALIKFNNLTIYYNSKITKKNCNIIFFDL